MNDFVKYKAYNTPTALAKALHCKPPHIVARKAARTKLYAMLYGPCASGVPHNNQPWVDANRRGHSCPSKAEFNALSAASAFNPVQMARAKTRFIHLGGNPTAE